MRNAASGKPSRRASAAPSPGRVPVPTANRCTRAARSSSSKAATPTEQRDGRHVGFFHGTGHGLGLELHEEPRFQKTRSFETGMVFTIEPGLYYPGLGGVRIEDVVAVTKTGCTLLSNFEQRLEI